jgi:predicted secreted hydrolase
MAHFALTDVGGNTFHAFDRFARDGAALAGAESAPFHVWTGSWQASGDPQTGTRLQASAENVAIDLVARSTKPPVLQGNNGLSQKSSGAGNASYYYSLTRMATEGTLTVGGTTYNVTGSTWKDREWSTSVLEQDQVGWDWFALHFADGRDLMYYQIRMADGSIEPLSSGTLVAADGSTTRIARDDIQIEVLNRWQSPRSGAQYPSRWRVRVPKDALDLAIEPYIADQELPFSVTYWEGAVRVIGTGSGQPITGNGYIEMTGYSEQKRSAVENRSP